MFQYLPQLLEASVTTVQIAVLGSLVAIVAAFVAGLARVAPWRPLRFVSRVYVEIFRGTAALVLLFWMYYALPFLGLALSAFSVAFIGLGLNVGAYGAEVVRSAIQAVPKGQHDAATALGLTSPQRMVLVVLPQALLAMVPPFGNLLIELLKGTALVSMITITDLTFRAVQLNTNSLDTLAIFTNVLIIYFVLASVITLGTRHLERLLVAKRGGR
jgi:polar amino acid transport system permease protein